MKNSNRVFLSPPHMGGEELGFIQAAFQSNYIAPLGKMVDDFENEFSRYTGIHYCLAVNSGTAAIHLALRELGVGPGEFVLAPSLTFIGSVSPAIFLGASITFIDSDRESWNMDPALLETELVECARRGKLPKVVIPTDLYGQCADAERINDICARFDVPVVADAAEAVGAKYQENKRPTSNVQHPTSNEGTVPQHASPEQGEVPLNRETLSSQPPAWRHAGYGAKAAIYSFNGNKIITTSAGGMLASEDKGLIDHARKLSQQAREPAPYYEHTEIGYNYRMSNIVAAIGCGQLRVLDQRVARKREVFASYQALLGGLRGIEFMPEPAYSCANRWLTVILIDEAEFGASPETIRLALEAENIESRPLWKPMHLQPVFRGYPYRGTGVSDDLFRRGLCLPSGTAMTESDLERVAAVIQKCRAGRQG